MRPPFARVVLLLVLGAVRCSSPTQGTMDGGSDGASDAAMDIAADAVDLVVPSDVGADASSDGTASDATGDAPIGTACAELGTLDPWANRIGAHTIADRGTLLSCVHAGSFPQSVVAASPYFAGQTAQNGYELYVLQYVSVGPPDAAVAVTALAYVPQVTSSNIPIVAVDHGTSGMGPSCGPTHATAVADYMAVPLVGRGYAVVATDYEGMGVDNGLAPYGVGANEAAGTIDSIRALRQLHDSRFDAGLLGTDLFVMGHSQGGQAALFTHAAYDNSLGLNLLGSIEFAPGFGSLHGFNTLWYASRSTDAIVVLLTMGFYAHMGYYGVPDVTTWLTPSAASMLPTMLHDQCLTELLVTVPSQFPTEGDLFTTAFLSSASQCGFAAPCPGFAPWADELSQDVPGDFASTAPVLIAQGERDTVVAPSSASCVVDRLNARGTPVAGCGYANDDHLSIVGTSMPDVLRWMNARRTGQTIDVCPAPIAEPCF